MNKDLIKAQVAMLLATAMSSDASYDEPTCDISTKAETKECAYSKCDKQHSHNNSCCSAEHFKLYMEEKKK